MGGSLAPHVALGATAEAAVVTRFSPPAEGLYGRRTDLSDVLFY